MQDDEDKKDPSDKDRSFDRLLKIIELMIRVIEILVELING